MGKVKIGIRLMLDFGWWIGGGAAVAGSLGKIRNAEFEMRNGKWAFGRCLILDWVGDFLDGEFWILDAGFIQNSKLLIQNPQAVRRVRFQVMFIRGIFQRLLTGRLLAREDRSQRVSKRPRCPAGPGK